MSIRIDSEHKLDSFTSFDQSSTLFEWLRGQLTRLSARREKVRTHHYESSDSGTYFFFEKSPENPEEFYMTAQNSRVRAKDLIELNGGTSATTYEVVEMSFYSDLSSMWTARLVEVSSR